MVQMCEKCGKKPAEYQDQKIWIRWNFDAETEKYSNRRELDDALIGEDDQEYLCAECAGEIPTPLGDLTLWVAIPVYEGIIEEIGVFDSKEKAVAWLKQITEGDLDDEDRVCDGDWAGSSVEEVIVQ